MSEGSAPCGSTSAGFKERWPFFSLLAILALTAALRIHLLEFPLERDEGEYAYAGQLMLQGIPPYQEVYTMKWPGTHLGYALIMAVLGQTTAGIHAGLMLINLATIWLMFTLSRRLLGNVAGVTAALLFALLSSNPAPLGFSGHATHFVMLPALAGIVFLQGMNEQTSLKRIFASGLLLGIAILMKQTGAAFALFAGCWIGWLEYSAPNRNWTRLIRRMSALAAGGALPFIATCLWLAGAGVFQRFWLWTVQYAGQYAAVMTSAEAVRNFKTAVGIFFPASPLVWLLALIGTILLFIMPQWRPHRFFITGFALASLLAVCPGWYFREHYFIQLLPAVALLAGVAVSTLYQRCRNSTRPFLPVMVTVLLLSIVCGWTLYVSRAILFQMTPNQASRSLYGPNPFPESVEIARFLAKICPADARIVVLGSEPEIYFYSRRRAGTGYIYTYPLMEPQPFAARMQQEMIQEIERTNPDYVVLVSVSYSWLARSDSNYGIFEWFNRYREQHLQAIGLAQIVSRDRTDYYWSMPAEDSVARVPNEVTIYRNKNANRSTSAP